MRWSTFSTISPTSSHSRRQAAVISTARTSRMCSWALPESVASRARCMTILSRELKATRRNTGFQPVPDTSHGLKTRVTIKLLMSTTSKTACLSAEQTRFFRTEGYLIYRDPVLPQVEFDALKNHFEQKLARLPLDVRPESMDV